MSPEHSNMAETRADGTPVSVGPAISVRNLSKAYGDNKVIDNMSFDLERGRVYVVMGPSG